MTHFYFAHPQPGPRWHEAMPGDLLPSAVRRHHAFRMSYHPREDIAQRFAEIHPPLDPEAALVEANRCLYCFDAPCSAACPTHIDVPRFIKKIATGNLRGSALGILDANILGASCSRVCPVDVLCEGACVLHRYNKQPMRIGRLQRHAMDHFYGNGARLPFLPGPERVNRVACIGAGPASLACAAELRKHGYGVTIFESRPLPGGLNTYGVAEYKLRPSDSLREVELIKSLGVEFRFGVSVGSAITVEELEQTYAAVFLAVGLGPPTARVAWRRIEPCCRRAQFHRRLQNGADHFSGPQGCSDRRRRRRTIDAANAGLRLGAEEVYMVYRRSEREMPAFQFEYENAKLEGVRFRFDAAGRDPIKRAGMRANGVRRTRPVRASEA